MFERAIDQIVVSGSQKEQMIDILAMIHLHRFGRLTHPGHGFYIEAGAARPLLNSNTWFFQNNFGWKGVLIEPNPEFIAYHKKDNPRYQSPHRPFFFPYALGTKHAKMRFSRHNIGETSQMVGAPKQKPLIKFHKVEEVTVQTRHIEDILLEADAPQVIDFVSLDIEGMELQVLPTFFEHNRTYRLFCVETIRVGVDAVHDLIKKHDYICVGHTANKQNHFYTPHPNRLQA